MFDFEGDLAPIGQSTVSLLAATDIFFEESYWRDHLCFSWDFHTWRGPEEMSSFLQKLGHGCRFRRVSIDNSGDPDKRPALVSADHYSNIRGVQLYIDIETIPERGRAWWKAFTIYTGLVELRGHAKTIGRRRRSGHIHSLPGTATESDSWQRRRTAQKNFEGDSQPTVLVIGPGQAGLSAGARLTPIGLGDCWRTRYLRLVLHGPVWYNHMPYLPFPVSWPVFAAKDQVAEFLEAYGQLMELNVWSSATLKRANCDGSSWEVTIEHHSEEGGIEVRTLRTHHIIQATGVNGEPKIPRIEGLSDFRGHICHSSQFSSAEPATPTKQIVVVGTGVSGHDIAQDFYGRGHHVTLVQRSPTCIDTTAYVYGQGLYSEDGPAAEDADFLTHSVPLPLLNRREIEKTDQHMIENKEHFEGLEKAGFRVDRGPDGAGRKFKFLQYAGGSYIDVKQGAVARINLHSLLLDDGTKLPADEIVFATGYSSMLATTRKIIGADFTRQLKEVNFALCRYYSKILAPQIKAIEDGIMRYEDL
ncbi:hypothetical protein B0T24DRAFT_652243 [Lasiosphaeria ovina]|uniref:FAD/NAD(P)-binding domain-containing protein n=1 Tax=Lasiosphaeria ovina TaxID=92902 RepID=A0AAE0JVI9_9PEZI|nr:hypothetical protein B0T24DRAFT_652243 [Lasiosphaeria ovina]